MKKSNFCSDHFVLNCKLCSEEAPPTPLPEVKPSVPKLTEEVIKNIQESEQRVEDNTHPEPPPVSSPEAQAVLSVTDEYARACDDFAAAVNAVTNIEAHIDRLQAMKLSLQADVVGKKTRKEELRKKVLETLGE